MDLKNTIISFPFVFLWFENVVIEFMTTVRCLQDFIIRNYKPGRYITWRTCLVSLGSRKRLFPHKTAGGFASYPRPLDYRGGSDNCGMRTEEANTSLGTG